MAPVFRFLIVEDIGSSANHISVINGKYSITGGNVEQGGESILRAVARFPELPDDRILAQYRRELSPPAC